MPGTERIEELLREKVEIDDRRLGAGLSMISHDRWLADSVEALLRMALEEKARQQPPEGRGGAFEKT